MHLDDLETIDTLVHSKWSLMILEKNATKQLQLLLQTKRADNNNDAGLGD